MVLKKAVNNKGLNGTTELVGNGDIKRQHAEKLKFPNCRFEIKFESVIGSLLVVTFK